MERKLTEWMEFCREVADHINHYCIPQYGDYPDEMIEGWGVKSIKTQLEKYVGRIGTGVRGTSEAERDTLKIAHYACLLAKKIEEETE